MAPMRAPCSSRIRRPGWFACLAERRRAGRSRSIMSIEAQFVLPDDGPRRPVGEYVRLLTEAGYPCREQPDPHGHWVVFDGQEFTLNFSVEDGAAVFVTLEMSWLNPPEA